MKLIVKITLILILIAHHNVIKANFPEENPKEISTNKNPEDSLYLPIQISFVPNFGTCGLHTDNLTTNLSINILVGKIYEIKGMEVGGIINIVRNNASSCQLAGIGNFVNGKLTGIQGAGILNYANTLDGIQIAGIKNSTEKASGMQIAGIINYAATGKCAQLAGIINNSRESAQFQIAGLINNTTVADYFQLSGLVNNCEQTHFQISGLMNKAQKAEQFQIAGLINNTSKETHFQIAGLINKAPEIKNIQIAGLINNANIAGDAQIAGLVNKANYVKGIQLGIINIADSCSGIPIGLINIIHNGYRTFELSGDELLYTNVAFRSGTQQFHGIITAGIKPDNFNTPEWSYGAGFGSLHSLGRTTQLGIDITLHNLVKRDYIDDNFLYKMGAGIDQRISNKLSIYCGVTLNFLVSDKHQSKYSEIYTSTAPYHIFENENNHFGVKSWIGGKIGLRIF